MAAVYSLANIKWHKYSYQQTFLGLLNTFYGFYKTEEV